MKAVILAGGKSSRMGQDKAAMMLNGKTILQAVTDNMQEVFGEIFISGNRQQFQRNIIKDIVYEKGPMGGILSALEYLKEDIFVCSCDMPFVSSELFKNIMEATQKDKINVAVYGEKIYPVLGFYPYSSVEALKESIEKDKLRMTVFLSEQNANYVQCDHFPKDQFLNINTPENFRNALVLINQLKK